MLPFGRAAAIHSLIVIIAHNDVGFEEYNGDSFLYGQYVSLIFKHRRDVLQTIWFARWQGCRGFLYRKAARSGRCHRMNIRSKDACFCSGS